MMENYDEWECDILEYFIKEIDIWLKYFVNGKIEEIKVYIADYSARIGMELLMDDKWYQLCFANDEWQTKYLENVSNKIRDDVKGSCFLDEIWFYFCEEASDDEKKSMIKEVIAGLQKRYNCKAMAINKKIHLIL